MALNGKREPAPMPGLAVAAENSATSPITLLAVLLAEASWLYAALGYLAATVGLSVVFSPFSVLVPFCAGCLTTVLVASFGNSLVPGSPREGSDPARGASGAGWRARLVGGVHKAILSGVAATVYVALGVVSLLGTAWWELYRDRGLIDHGWINSMMEDARLSNDFVAPLAWLVIVGTALWVRGTVLARGDRGFPPVLARAAVGTSVLMALALVGPTPQVATSSILVFAVYLLSSFGAVSSSRLDAVSSEGGVTPPWRWGSALLSISLLAVGLASTVALVWWAAEPIRAAWDAVVATLAPVATAIAAWLAQLFGHEQPLAQLPASPAGNPGDVERSAFSFPEQIREVARWLFNLGWMATILFAIYTTVDRWLTGDKSKLDRGVSRERVGFGWWENLQRLLAGIVLALSRWCPPIARLLRRRGLDRQGDTVREIYRRLLGWSAAEGVAIETGTTPREHRAAMAAAWPHLAAEFDRLTESYLWARFSGLPVRGSDLDASVAGWRRISASSRRGRRSESGETQ